MEIFGLLNPFVFIIVLVLISLLGVISIGFDKGRVERCIGGMGGTLLDWRWAPLSSSPLGQKDWRRYYQIEYRDQAGHIHRALAKVSSISGVYLTDDCVIGCSESAATAKPQSRG